MINGLIYGWGFQNLLFTAQISSGDINFLGFYQVGMRVLFSFLIGINFYVIILTGDDDLVNFSSKLGFPPGL